LFLLSAGLFLFLCRDHVVRSGAGDEPHYLIVADSFAHFGGAKIAEAYLQGPLAKSLLSPTDLAHTRQEAAAAQGPFGDFHGYGGPNGLYSIHNIGLPLLMVPVRWLGGGMLAAKLALLLCSILLPLMAARAASLFVAGEGYRLLGGAALCLATPFLISASQLYPDLLAGILFAFVLLELCATRLGKAEPDRLRAILCAAALALAPWLHLRLAMPALLCAIGWVLLARGVLRGPRLAWAIAPLASLAGLALYNHYAYGLVGGAYDKSAVEVSPMAVMVLFGLQLDQFQGVFLRAPLLLAALPGLALLARRDWPFALLFLLTYGTLVGPNAFHPNWYGGGSFGGRFMLAGAVTLIVPAALALGLLFERRPRTAMVLCAASLLIQLQGWSRFSLGSLPIYNQSADRLLEDYAAPLGHPVWLPAFYRLDLATHHWPNLAWLVAALLLLLAGWMAGGARRAAPFAYAALAVIVAGGVAGRQETPIWQVAPRDEIAAYAGSHSSEMTHIVYGDPAELPTAGLLAKQLTMAGATSCVDLSAPEDAAVTAAHICGENPLESRLALVRTDGWHILAPSAVSETLLSVDFSRPEDAHYLTKGWSQQENWGVWSAADRAELTLDLPRAPTGGLRLDVQAQAFLPEPEDTLVVPVEVDGHLVATWRFSHLTPSDRAARSLWIPADLAAGKTYLTVTFRLDGAKSPKALGLSSDDRLLGIGLRQADLRDLGA
jgi:hypothetical protein